MSSIRVALFAFLLSATVAVPAVEPSDSLDAANAANTASTTEVENPLSPLLSSLFPNTQPTPAVHTVPSIDPSRSCESLYREVTYLVPHTHPPRSDFYSDSRNESIGIASVFFFPAITGWGYTAFTRYQERELAEVNRDRVAQLRGLLADKRCFER